MQNFLIKSREKLQRRVTISSKLHER